MKLMSLLGPQPSQPLTLASAGAGPGLRHVRDVALDLGRGAAPRPGVDTFAGASGNDIVAWRSERAEVVDPSAVDVWLSEHVVTGQAELFEGSARRQQDAEVVKIVAFLVRRPGITTEQFASYWLHQHAPLALDIVPADAFGYAYVQNHSVRSSSDQAVEVARPTGGFDGVAELYFRDLDHMTRWARWFSSDDGARLRHDEYEFMDPDKRVIVVAREHVLAG